MWKTGLVLAVALVLGGCASVVNDVNQPMKVETKTSAGKLVAGADCRLTNDHGTVVMRSGETVQVHRSAQDLQIACTHAGQPGAAALAISRANAGVAGNILIGGGIGAIIDHNRGTAYNYPGWLQLVFGQTLMFDRRADKDGQPTPPESPSVAK